MKAFVKKIILSLLIAQAKYILDHRQPTIVAITGSVGKTTTKDAVAAVLEKRFTVRKSEKSYNSEFGVPLTIIGAHSGWNSPFAWLTVITKGVWTMFFATTYPELLVLEVGADKPGDIAAIATWVKAKVVIVTAVPEVPVHIAQYPTAADVLHEKAQLLNSLIPQGVLITGDDANVTTLENKADTTVRVHAPEYTVLYEKNMPTGMQYIIDDAVSVTVQGVLGGHYGYAIAFAFASAKVFGIPPAAAASAIENMSHTPGRMRLIPGLKKTVIIDDSYNASPIAMHAALNTLDALQVPGKKIVLLGDMRELGAQSAAEHEAVAKKAAQVADMLYFLGDTAEVMADTALKSGANEDTVYTYACGEAVQAGEDIAAVLQKGDVLLVKGSQTGIRLEQAVQKCMRYPEKASSTLVRQDKEWQ